MIPTRTNELTFASIDPGAGLRVAIRSSPQELCNTVVESGLRGRGGAGFPTGRKWQFAAEQPGDKKYIICNADEGEPGTFKDRLLLSDYAGLVLDGMVIAARAVGATEGIIYLRGEYGFLRSGIEETLASYRQDGLLGRNIGGVDDFDFEIEIRMGAGAYICGEETALIESLEGKRGEPRKRPPFPVQKGLHGKPTVVNNVETFAWVAAIFAKGVDFFSAQGTESSKGFKLLSVSGDCERPGVYEVPFGITLAQLLEQVGGRGTKAVQVGGASGECVPAKDFGRRIAFEDLATGGSVILFADGRDMLAVAENFLEFFEEESCGQCTPCRGGNRQLLQGVRRLREGRCSMTDVEQLCELGETMQVASKCGLGQSSPNAFLSIVRNFGEEILGRAPSERAS